jgi:hypothetical protein
LAAWLAAPPIFVKPAFSRSVPTAVTGETPNAEHKERGHQRAAADAGEADDGPDDEARDGIGNLDHSCMVGKALMTGKYLVVLWL